MKKQVAYLAATFVLPTLAFAQAITSVQSGATWIINFINTIAVPLVFAVAFLVFIVGILQYFILGRGNEEAAAQGRQFMLWGIVGFFVMLSVWGLVNILVGTFNLNSSAPHYPVAPTQ